MYLDKMQLANSSFPISLSNSSHFRAPVLFYYGLHISDHVVYLRKNSETLGTKKFLKFDINNMHKP